MAILKILVILLILAIPLGVVTRITVIPGFSFYIHDILVLLIFLITLFIVAANKKKINNNYIVKPLLIFFCSAVFSLIWNLHTLSFQNFLIALSYLIRYFMYFSLVFTISFFNKEFIFTLKKLMIASGLIFIIFGFIQYLYYPDLQNLFYLGWDEHLARFFSTFLDPNFTGAFLVLYFIFIMDILVNAVKIKKGVLVYLFICLATLAGIFFSYSRGAFIMLIVAVMLYFLIKSNLKVLFFAIIGLVIVFFLFSNPAVEEFNPFRIASSRARVESLRGGVSIFVKNPIFGVGFNAYRYAQIRYGLRDDVGGLSSNADAGTDNSILFVLATTGIVGFLAFINLWKHIIFKAITLIKKQDSFAVVVLVSVLSVFINSFFINSLFYSLILIWLFVLVGMMKVKKNK